MPKQTRDRDPKLKRIFVHGLRVAIFVAIIWMIRSTHSKILNLNTDLESNPAALNLVQRALSGANIVLPNSSDFGANPVANDAGETIGFVLQTSPQSDHIIGYSGPTNCLIAFDTENQIQAIEILGSGDTIDHVDAIRRDQAFLDSFQGIGFGDSDSWEQIDAVSGATLTSYSIIASVANRMGSSAPSLKFSDRPNTANVRTLFQDVSRIEPTDQDNIWDVYFHSEKVGYVISTTPYADQLSGYQGPTVTISGFDSEGKCIGLIVDQTYENEPYASYLNDDRSFQKLYIGKSLAEIAQMNPETDGIDGVSGATMTSVCVADGIFLAAKKTIEDKTNRYSILGSRNLVSYWSDLATVFLTILGIAFSFGWFKKNKRFRVLYQVAVIAFLGFINGHMLSQASIVGWSQNAVPWTVVPGLVFLSLAAFAIPIVSKHQPYCHHICPFGAIQQLAKKRVKWKLKIPTFLNRILGLIPFALLLLVLYVAISGSGFNLASIEPFDGFSIRVAGWATISIFIVGFAFSIFSPMAYCRYGCPTGALLGFLKFRSDSHRLGTRDWAAMTLLAIAVVMSRL